MSYITAIGTATPPNKFDQTTLADFMVNVMHADEDHERKIKTVFRASGIRHRYSVLDDYGKRGNFTVYPNNGSGTFPGTAQRMQLYRKHALPLSVAAIEDLQRQARDLRWSTVTHLVVISCTGMYAPGLDIDIIKHFDLATDTERMCINFMGCYAAFNGIKAADAICRSNVSAKVLVVCTELCSLHFQPNPDDDNILANALFADGAAALLIEASPDNKKSLSLELFHSDLALNGEHDMAWSVADSGFEMRLSAYVPDLLRNSIAAFYRKLLEKGSFEAGDVKHFAIHPGGKKILQAIERELELTKEQNRFAYQILENFGNMSSPTVVFVLKAILDQLQPDDNNALIWSAAFGPGLTLESMLLKAQVYA